MNGKTILAVILGAAVHFFLGWLIYGMLLMDFMTANTVQYEGLMVEGSEAIIGYALSSLLLATLITYFLSKTNIRNAQSALVGAAILTFLISASLDAMFYFGMNMYSAAAVVVDIIAFTVMGSLTGLTAGLVLFRKKESAATSASVA